MLPKAMSEGISSLGIIALVLLHLCWLVVSLAGIRFVVAWCCHLLLLLDFSIAWYFVAVGFSAFGLLLVKEKKNW